MVQIRADASQFSRALVEFCTATGKEIAAELPNQARLLIQGSRSVPGLFDITPPAGGSVTGPAAKKRGEAAITGDLFGGRRVSVGGFTATTRGLFIVSETVGEERDEIVSLFTNKDGVTYGVEKKLYRPAASTEEMIAHVAKYRSKATGRISRAGLRTRNVGRHVFIDRMVIRPSAAARLLRTLHGRVGSLAAGWLPAAQRLGARRIPTWVRRHAARAQGYGGITIQTGPRGGSIEFWMNPKFSGDGIRGMERRLQRVLTYRAGAMLRQVDAILKKKAARIR